MKTDNQLQQDVLDELKWEPEVEASRIGVEAKDGIVTLAGHVESFAQKWAAECAAQRVAGVKGVVVEIDVALPGTHQRRDEDLVRAANHALDWHSSVPKGAIKVLVEGGYVTLTGEVDWAFQRAAAVGAMRNLVGVLGVSDRISLKSRSVPAATVKKQIHAALHRQAQHEANAIKVAISGNNVTLSGIVDSWSQRAAARNAAWAAPGVQKVVDNLSVAD